MIAYFKKVLRKNEKKQGCSEALRQVQLEMLRGEKYHHPYSWAAFIPSGDWQEMPKNVKDSPVRILAKVSILLVAIA